MPHRINLQQYGLHVDNVLRNPPAATLYEHAIHYDGAEIAASGALAVRSGEKCGRSPADKRVVEETTSKDDVWWGDVNIPLSPASFQRNRSHAIEFFNRCERLYVIDAFAGWDPGNRIKVRIICSRPYHAIFMTNMLIRPTREEINHFGEPDYVIFNAGSHRADEAIDGVDSATSVALNFALGEFVILGTQYAGEMKKGVFTIMNYLLPKRGVLSMHCSANEGNKGDVSLFFGLSGTGKTTLSADPQRDLIGDDEHGWGDDGVFNIEGGCYAKCIDLSSKSEPEIYSAIRFGAVLENTVVDQTSREVDYHDSSLTENTRASYPIEFIPHAKIPCRGRHPWNIVFLTCDAFGVLPPVSLLTPEQAMYHFISGYTAKVAGTEVGVTEPKATFSACFGAPFLVWHPTKYAELLAAKMREHEAPAYLVNTGWSGGAYGTGSRMSIGYTRAIIDAIHDGTLAHAETETDPVFGLETPVECANVPSEILTPRRSWADPAAYDATAAKLAGLFVENFRKFEDLASPEIVAAGPRVSIGARG
ncbi:MAG: phosphoenolpyruvate carboxykinase (ATP) [Planctomycetota bacterium]